MACFFDTLELARIILRIETLGKPSLMHFTHPLYRARAPCPPVSAQHYRRLP